MPAWLREPLSPPSFARLVLILIGAIWLSVATQAFANPHALARNVDIALTTPTALQEWRANYGGMAAMLALMHVGAALRGRWLWPAIWAAMLLMVGLLSGRIVSLALDGVPGAFGFFLAGTECGGIALCGLAIWRLHRHGLASVAEVAPSELDEGGWEVSGDQE